MMNAGFEKVISFFVGKDGLRKYDNIYRLIFDKDGLKPYIKDWKVIQRFLLTRLMEEAISNQNEKLNELYNQISASEESKDQIEFKIDNSLPIMSITLEKNSVIAGFFSTITTLKTPLDVTTQELRIESLFPIDRKTKRLFQNEFLN